MARMNILSSAERRAFDSPPELNSVERKYAFDFPVGVLDRAREMRKPSKQGSFFVIMWLL